MQGCVSFWSGRRVLINGCTGFLGAAVTRELFDRGAHVVSVFQEKKSAMRFASEHETGSFHIVRGRAEDASCIYSALAVHEVSTIFHLTDGSEAMEAAEDGVLNATMRAALLYQPKLPVVAARPSTPLRLLGTGARLPHGVARFGELFGPGDNATSRLVTRTIAGLMHGLPSLPTPSPHGRGDGDFLPLSRGERGLGGEGQSAISRDFVFVRDAARACLALAEAIGDGSQRLDIDFRSGWALTESDLVSLIGDLIAGQVPEARAEFETPFNPVGWQASMTLLAALGETIEWYREVRRSALTRPVDSRRKAA